MRGSSIVAGFVFISLAFSQVTTSLLDGVVSDPQGAGAAGAEIAVTNTENGQALKTIADERGHWLLPSMPAGNYRITVSLSGFRTMNVDGIKIDAGVPKSVNVKLEV